ncbi:LON peptidase substrate-binding domain-containing protein [Bosea sp. BH3]|uniref:LON peptidase substrate-binding domain-containing protein n=1 Tax=Bosea sp. BH3 TaxID=2871701 RepID=UPI0021CB5693|nr:LON peptidase substrate-binding domain-containing protein [Bosea sp. BH3]MCU4178750.1 LON peptidase substrate-binding domain-containing protein [Bosea sp. BH3]
MGMNAVYEGAGDCPEVVPLFPLSGALLLPRGQMPLNVFEPRYLAMVDDALKAGRVIGMIQPEPETGRQSEIPPLLKVGCLGRITQFAETGDGRYIVTLTGISRFRLLDELSVTTAYRQAKVDYSEFAGDFVARIGEEEVDRKGLLKALRSFAKANELKIDWKGVNEAPNEALVNALSMMCPFGPREKQALLEARSLKDRAEVLVAITEIELARGGGNPDTTLQ